MKTFITFLLDSVGLLFAPKRTLDEISAHYKTALLPLGFALSLLARMAFSVSTGVQSGWSPSTVFFDLASGYLGQFFFAGAVLSLMSLFHEKTNARNFWGLTFASDIPLFFTLPLVLLGTLLPLSLSFLTVLPLIWSAVLKLFIIQKILKANLSKAVILSIAPLLLIVLWMISGGVVLAEGLNGIMSYSY